MYQEQNVLRNETKQNEFKYLRSHLPKSLETELLNGINEQWATEYEPKKLTVNDLV